MTQLQENAQTNLRTERRMKNGQTLFHRTLPATNSGPKTEDVYKDIANDVEKSFNTSEYAFAFEDYKIHLYNNEIVLKSLQRFVSKAHKVFTEKFNEIAFSFNYDKRLQSFNGVKSYHIMTHPPPPPAFIYRGLKFLKNHRSGRMYDDVWILYQQCYLLSTFLIYTIYFYSSSF